MKIPAWSAFVIVPAILLSAAFPVIRDSESPGMLFVIALGMSLVVAAVSWGILKLLDRSKGDK